MSEVMISIGLKRAKLIQKWVMNLVLMIGLMFGILKRVSRRVVIMDMFKRKFLMIAHVPRAIMSYD